MNLFSNKPAKVLGTLALTLALALASCASPTENKATAPAKITSVGWIAENIDPSFWSGGLQNGRMYFDFWINYSGNVSADDIEYARIYLPDGKTWWELDLGDYLNTDNKFIGGYGRWSWSSDGRALPVGKMKAEIKFTNGTKASYLWQPTQPGATSAGANTVVVSEDNLLSYSSGTYTTALARPTNVSFLKDANYATVSFTLNDSRTYGGWVWFYDADNVYIGSAPAFRDKFDGSASSLLTGGLKTGAANTFTIPRASLLPISAHTPMTMLAAIDKCVVVTTDGGQYASGGHYNYYDFSAISAKYDNP